jgi:hypothetical protein
MIVSKLLSQRFAPDIEGRSSTIPFSYGSARDTGILPNIAKAKRMLKASVPVGPIEFEADQGPTYPWMTDFGVNLALRSNSRRSWTPALIGMADIL